MSALSHRRGLCGMQRLVGVLYPSGHLVTPWLHGQGLSLRHVGVRAFGLLLGIRQPRAKLESGRSLFSFCTPTPTWCMSYPKSHLSLILHQLSL